MARALFCSVDPAAYPPLDRPKRWDLSYLGTYSPDRQPKLERLLLEPARRAPHLRFAVAGPLYPDDIAWPENVDRLEHVRPADHPAFYAESRFTLNVTRDDMVRAGWSPSVRLFEAAACGTPIISDAWDGLDALFRPGREIALAEGAADVLRALGDDGRAIAAAARRRVLAEHTAAHRAGESGSAFRARRWAFRAARGAARRSGEGLTCRDNASEARRPSDCAGHGSCVGRASWIDSQHPDRS
jgi:spore maturation protein CgeB